MRREPVAVPGLGRGAGSYLDEAQDTWRTPLGSAQPPCGRPPPPATGPGGINPRGWRPGSKACGHSGPPLGPPRTVQMEWSYRM